LDNAILICSKQFKVKTVSQESEQDRKARTSADSCPWHAQY